MATFRTGEEEENHKTWSLAQLESGSCMSKKWSEPLGEVVSVASWRRRCNHGIKLVESPNVNLVC